MAEDHPTDNADHGLPEVERIPLGGEALQILRTEAEISGVEVRQVLAETLAARRWISEQLADGRTFRLVNPDGTTQEINWKFGTGGDNPLDASPPPPDPEV